MPTILDVTGAKYPTIFNGNKIIPLEAKSLRPSFMNGKQKFSDYQFWEHFNNCAVRKGKWKAISKVGGTIWQLCDIEKD